MLAPATRLPDLREPDVQDRLALYLRESWAPDASIGGLRRADGGFSNETWFLDVTRAGGTDRVVLRRQALVGPLEPYDLAREAAVLGALRSETGLPVPEVFRLCSDAAYLGSPFTLVERLEGDVPDYRSLPAYPPAATPAGRTAMARELMRLLAQIQSADWRGGALGALMTPPPPGRPGVVGRVDEWLGKLDARVGAGANLPGLRDTGAWLIAHAPVPADDWVLVHGDFRVGNEMWDGTRISAVLDWEGACVGDVFEDLGYLCHPMARIADPALMGMLVPYAELVELFEEAFGRPFHAARAHYYLIFGLFFHLSTLVSGLASANDGADLRAGLGYAKFARVTRELVAQIRAYEENDHVL